MFVVQQGTGRSSATPTNVFPDAEEIHAMWTSLVKQERGFADARAIVLHARVGPGARQELLGIGGRIITWRQDRHYRRQLPRLELTLSDVLIRCRNHFLSVTRGHRA